MDDSQIKHTSFIWTRVLTAQFLISLTLALLTYISYSAGLISFGSSQLTGFILGLITSVIAISTGVSLAFVGTHLVRESRIGEFCKSR